MPENAFVTNIDFTRQFFSSETDYFIGMTANYEDERFVDPDNGLAWDAYWLVDMRAAWRPTNGSSWSTLKTCSMTIRSGPAARPGFRCTGR